MEARIRGLFNALLVGSPYLAFLSQTAALLLAISLPVRFAVAISTQARVYYFP
uniref:Uncharacterized protein n=1 Tax=Vibrio genomosp. F6 TaxID=723172 RepID=A0A0H3ZSL5_9VIBR|nr:hypothetical protein [Vibrio genomosp. F6]